MDNLWIIDGKPLFLSIFWAALEPFFCSSKLLISESLRPQGFSQSTLGSQRERERRKRRAGESLGIAQAPGRNRTSLFFFAMKHGENGGFYEPPKSDGVMGSNY